VPQQLTPLSVQRPQRDPVLLSEFPRAADHPWARVGGDNIQAEVGEANS
jgi:hypothetical protein